MGSNNFGYFGCKKILASRDVLLGSIWEDFP